MPTDELFETGEPVRVVPALDHERELEDGIALCLSGGGYRAMLFHVGVLWRLNDAGYLPRLACISSVSGGSITAAVLGHRWSRMGFDETTRVATRFQHELVEPIRNLARTNVDVSAVVTGGVLPFTSIADRLAKAYDNRLYDGATLQSLPDEPRFVINATNLESGVLMRFTKRYLADYRVGRILDPDLPLAVAVAASSAFPPVLSPCTVRLGDEQWQTDEGNDLTDEEYRGTIRLSDGGVYDNLGLETAWKRYRTILVSDAGGSFAADPSPPSDWARHMVRVLKVIDNQVRALRKRQVIDAFEGGRRRGVYVGIRSRVDSYGLTDALAADPALTAGLAEIPTRLDDLSDELQERLVNWGYVIMDAGLRAHVDSEVGDPVLPYPDRPLTGPAGSGG